MARITKSMIAARFNRVCHVMGWSQDCWSREAGTLRNVANVGAVCLDYAPVYGGWQIHRMANDAGGITVITGSWNRHSGAELLAWMDGVLFAKQEAEDAARKVAADTIASIGQRRGA